MNGRLAQDAADALKWHEQEAFRQSERARWAKAQPPRLGPSWKPVITDEELAQRERDFAAGLIPF